MRGITSGPQVVQAYFPGGRLSETVRSWQARVRQWPVVQTREASKGHAFPTPPEFLKGRSQGGGQPLPATVKSQMESFFQTDFSQVRVHVGPEASSIGALAFTVGTDLYFAPGQYQPNTQSGRQLLGHELTHVVQQQQGRVANPYGSGLAVVHDPGLEEEAEQQGTLAAKHPGRGRPAGGQVQRSIRSQAAAEKPRGVQRAGGYKLIIGAYLHPKAAQLPEPLAGHSFVSIVHPDGNKKTYGFSPAHYGNYDPRRDLSKLRAGVPGVVHSDEEALIKPGVKVREYDVGATQAQAAMAKVEEYQSGKYRFNLTNRQCSAFALEVLRAANVEALSSPTASQPRDLYRRLPDTPHNQPVTKIVPLRLAQRAAEAVAEPSPEDLAKEIYKDMKRQFKYWDTWDGTRANRGAWWGAAIPGNSEGATRVPLKAIQELKKLTAKSKWEFSNSFSGGLSFHRRSNKWEPVFIYHMAPP